MIKIFRLRKRSACVILDAQQFYNRIDLLHDLGWVPIKVYISCQIFSKKVPVSLSSLHKGTTILVKTSWDTRELGTKTHLAKLTHVLRLSLGMFLLVAILLSPSPPSSVGCDELKLECITSTLHRGEEAGGCLKLASYSRSCNIHYPVRWPIRHYINLTNICKVISSQSLSLNAGPEGSPPLGLLPFSSAELQHSRSRPCSLCYRNHHEMLAMDFSRWRLRVWLSWNTQILSRHVTCLPFELHSVSTSTPRRRDVFLFFCTFLR